MLRDIPSLTNATAWLVAAALFLLAALPPASYFALGYMMERGMARSAARLTAKQISPHIQRNPDLWRFSLHRLSADLTSGDTMSESNVDRDERTLLDDAGNTLARGDEVAPPLPRPVIVEQVPLYDSDRVVAYLRVTRSLRGLMWQTIVFALLCGALAAGLFVIIERRPLRAMRQAEQRLHDLAHRDTLTGLPNRATFRHLLASAVNASRGSQRMVAVLFLDLDRFKRVNDTLGHQAGDTLLKKVARRIRAELRTDDLVARLSGDEFALMIRDIARPFDAAAVADKLLGALAAPYAIEGREIYVTPSVGIALAPLHGDTPEALLKCADMAMYAAKRQGGSRHRIYEPQTMTGADTATLELDRRLREALRKNEFRLVYQPIVAPASGRIIGAEALLRWHSPQLGVMSPANFVPLLEETGLIVPVGEWVLREAVRQASTWIGRSGAEFVLSVNVSPRQFKDGDIVDMVRRVLSETGFPAEQLQLEVTEGLLMADDMPSREGIERLAQMGIRFAVDDFGTGYASLAYLRRFKLNGVKIDRSFVREMDSKADDATIVRAVAMLAHNLGLNVTAEGVETEAQRAMLLNIGCDRAQGFLFAKPLNPSEIDTLLARQEPAVETAAA